MPASPLFSSNRFLQILLAGYALVWIGAAIRPRDWPTWTLENLPVVIFIGILALTYRRFTFSNPSYLLIAIVLSLHAVGAHSGYAETPIGYWLPVSLVLTASVCFEIIEAVVAWLVDPDLGAAYLGIQGDVWDAQKDMALVILGAALTVGLAVLARTSWSGRPSRRQRADC